MQIFPDLQFLNTVLSPAKFQKNQLLDNKFIYNQSIFLTFGMKKRLSNLIDIKVVTWEKQSHGLFDYESKSLKQKHYQIQNSCVLLQNQKDYEVQLSPESSLKNFSQKHNYTILGAMDFHHSNDNYSFRSIKADTFELKEVHDPYLVVRSLKNNQGHQKGYPLKLGDIIKFGRLQYIVLEYRDEKNTYSHGNMNINFQTHYANNKLSGVCKICLSEQQQQENFLISPCDCKGSCELVHLLCLKQWIQSKICKETHGIVQSYNFTKYQCEICKIAFPQRVIRGAKQYQMLMINKPNQPYLILQSISQKKDCKNLYLITHKKTANIKLGRGHECDIRMSDISVSRVHAQISFKNNKFYIFDNSSKFGTLIKIENNYALNNERCAIQIGRTVIICSSKSSLNQQQIKDYKKQTQAIQYSFKTISK